MDTQYSLVCHLRADLAGWGSAHKGDQHLPCARVPTRSALLGFLGAALGIYRKDSKSRDSLRKGIKFVVRVDQPGVAIIDYQNVQSPVDSSLATKMTFQSRKAEVEYLRQKNISGTRQMFKEYLQDAVFTVFICGEKSLLTEVKEALEHPHFVLFAGRKCCPLNIPLCPRILEYDDLEQLMVSEDASIPSQIMGLFPRREVQGIQSRRRRYEADAALVPYLNNWSGTSDRNDEPLSRNGKWIHGHNQVVLGHLPSIQDLQEPS